MNKEKTRSPDDLPLFSYWSTQKIDEYTDLYIEDFRDNPSAPPRKGIPPGQEYPFSLTKYNAAVHSVLYGQKLSMFSLQLLLDFVNPKPSLGLFRVWRSETRFKLLVEELREEYARHVAENIFYGKAEGYEPTMPVKGLDRKIRFIKEAINYSPDLLEKICTEMSKLIVSNSKMRSITDYLGHHIWCIMLLYFPQYTGKKSPQRAIFLNVCEKIIGCHWQNDDFLPNYIKQNIPKEWREWSSDFQLSGGCDDLLKRGLFDMIQDNYRREIAAIINTEILKLSDSKNTIELTDLMAGINYLANKYQFRSDQI